VSARAALVLALALAAPALAGPERITNARTRVRVAADPAPVASTLGASAPEWLAWTVPGLPAVADLCCFGRDWRSRGCSLAGRDQGWGTQTEGAPTSAPAELLVLVEIERGRPIALRSAGPSCPIAGAGRAVTWLEGVDPDASLAPLDTIARAAARHRSGEPGDAALAALAHHLSPAADHRLAALAGDRGLDPERRGEALFWAGSVRGRAGYELLDRTLAAEPATDLRGQATFALSQSPVPEAASRLRRVAREDRDPEVRGQALFALTQGPARPDEAAPWILDAIANDPDPEVREQGLFALSQLETGTAHLIRLLRETRDPGIRRQALFWLGQSEDPQAFAELARLLEE
jgi:hypothetical protein